MILIKEQIMKKFSYNTPIGKIWIAEKENKICAVSLNEITTGQNIETPLIYETHKQLQEYFNKKRKTFDLPLLLSGTEFQKRVWQALIEIPYGKTMTYKEVAAKIGNPSAQRAVGMANHNNKIMIIIPCHRVIGQNGQLTGYAGGIDVKQFLLNLEQH